MAKTGPKGPRIEINDEDFERIINMIRIHCTKEEIASVFQMSPDTLGRRIQDRGYENFADLYKRYSGEGAASLRRAQWQLAQNGNATMLIWLGKQILGQRDNLDHRHSGPDGGPIKADVTLDWAKFDLGTLEKISDAFASRSTDRE